MCGIAGLVPSRNNIVPGHVVREFTNELRHRGPDDFGYLRVNCSAVRRGREFDGNLQNETLLTHHRLSILDLTAAGWQPMSTEDGRYHLIFNGEIYNYLELRQRLDRAGYVFQSRTDSEVLLKALVAWGTDALPQFIGMFAFAFLDLTERTLLLARDQFGIKPLYYARFEGGFAFASEIKSLLRLPGISRNCNPQRIYEYLRFGLTDHGEETFLKSVRQLPAAHFMEVSLDSGEVRDPRAYWSAVPSEKVELPFDEAAEKVRELFLRSIALHMRSDVPVGAALSGGIDSSAIVMAMRRLNPQQDIHTFSYIAANSPMNEERFVDIVAREAGTIGHKIVLRPEELLADIDDLVNAQDEPFGSTSVYGQYRIFRLARDAGIKVMLDGQGGDELFAGYSHYLTARLATLVRQGRWVDAWQFGNLAGSQSFVGAGWLVQSLAEYLLPQSIQNRLRVFVRRELYPRWLNADWFLERGCVAQPTKRASGTEVLKEELHRSLSQTMLPHLLRYEDRNSMAHSIESRVPFLTPELASFAYSLPDHYLIGEDGLTKSVFRRAMQGIVPDAILSRRDKIGFATPEREWLLAITPWAKQVFDSASDGLVCFRLAQMRREWDDMVEGRRQMNHCAWRWLNFLVWAQRNHICFT